MIGLSDNSQTQEKVVSENGDIVKYSIQKETIDRQSLLDEKERIEGQLTMPEPSTEELIALGKGMHPYYMRNIQALQTRIDEINTLLG